MSFSENFINIMDAIGKQLGIAIDWTSQNVVPYLEQLSGKIVNYELYMSIAGLAFSIAIIAFGIFLYIVPKKGARYSYYYEEWTAFKFAMSIMCIIVGILLIITNGMDIITCLTLPEKAIIEFIMKYK